MSCEKCGNPDDGGSGICDSCFDEEYDEVHGHDKIPFIPPHVMIHEGCGGKMIEAPRGSLNLGCMKCGFVKYGVSFTDKPRGGI